MAEVVVHVTLQGQEWRWEEKSLIELYIQVASLDGPLPFRGHNSGSKC
jgi:hypothetical protein